MASYQELSQIGESFDAFVARSLEAERTEATTLARRLSMTLSCPIVERLEAIRGRYHLLVAGEMWCPDCRINITALNTMHRLQPRIDVSVISRGRAENELKQRLGLDRIPIPLVAVLDERYALLGLFVEQPQMMSGADAGVKQAYRDGQFMENTLDEVLAIIERVEKAGSAPVGTATPCAAV
ncbi:thioredoxin family protein [Pseudomonas sp. Marseille-QA0892]